jgi:Family of unknown function (DUF6152)
MKKLFPAALLTLAGLLSTHGAWAHHSFSSEFDSEKPLEVKGVVTKARLVNPHSWLYFDVKNADGTITNWGVELAAPAALLSKGITKEDLKPGVEVQVKGFRAKNGGPFGYAVTTTLPDGRKIQTGGAQDNPAAARAPAGN